MQKVVVVNIRSAVASGFNYVELEFPTLNNYLNQGYKIVQFQEVGAERLETSDLTAPKNTAGTGNLSVQLIFILEK